VAGHETRRHSILLNLGNVRDGIGGLRTNATPNPDVVANFGREYSHLQSPSQHAGA